MIKTCQLCDKEFNAKTKREKYCPVPCRKQAALKKQKDWAREHATKIKGYVPAYRFAKPENEEINIIPPRKPSTLDAKMNLAAAQGMTYAEMQKQETLNRAGKIQI